MKNKFYYITHKKKYLYNDTEVGPILADVPTLFSSKNEAKELLNDISSDNMVLIEDGSFPSSEFIVNSFTLEAKI